MDAEQALDRFIADHQEDTWLDHSDGYQFLLEHCGENLIAGLLRLTKHPRAEIRAVSVSMLATRRPHTAEMIEAIGPLINDPNPLVRIRTLTHLAEFGDLASTLVPDAYALVEAEKSFSDQTPRVAAISFLLHHDRSTWEFLIHELVEILVAEKGDLAEFQALRTLIDLGVISSEPGADDAVGPGG